METKKVVVVGATGSLGGRIAKALIDQGAEVTAMVRTTSNRSNLEKMGVRNFVIGNLMSKESLQEAFSHGHGFNAVVVSAAGYTKHTKGDNPKTDTIGYQNLVDAVKEAGIPRFVLISILECDKAVNVPHFYNKYLVEKYLEQKQQPFIALRAGAFLDQTPDFIIPKITKGILPVFFKRGEYGTIYTQDLARYTAMAAISLPDSALNSSVDVGWSSPVDGDSLAKAFSKVLDRPVKAQPAIPPFFTKVVMPLMGVFNSNVNDMVKMIKWVKTGLYISRNTQKQKDLFGDLPTVEEAVRRYCRDNNLVS
jgi:uncharacterized protein YbjT (DUF2867 family)